jgi:hypothetical protein
MSNTPRESPNISKDPELPRRYAEVVIDALLDAGLIARKDIDEAVRIAATEIQVRQSLDDR